MFARTILLKAGQRLEKQKTRILGCSFLLYFLSLHSRKTALPCKQLVQTLLWHTRQGLQSP